MKRSISRTALSTVAAALAFAACGGGTTGPGGADPSRVLAVGVARQDLSPDPVEGVLAFFFDLDADRLLSAQATIGGDPVSDSLAPGIVEGQIYLEAIDVMSGDSFRLSATVQTALGPVQVTSTPVVVPAAFEIEVPENHPLGQPLTVRWTGVVGADRVNVAAGSGFTIDVAPAAGSVEIPSAAFDGLAPGEIEIEVTAFQTFYAPVSAGIGSLTDAETFADELGPVDNIEGAVGAFGAATTVGAIVMLE